MDENIYNDLFDVADDKKDKTIKPSDKLNYKQVIQYHALECQRAIGKTYYPNKVEGFKECIYFDIPGLFFKTKIDKYIKKLNFTKAVIIRCRERINKNEMCHPLRRLIVEWDVEEWYYRKLNNFLLQLVAQYKGLLDMKGLVEEGMDQDIEIKKENKKQEKGTDEN